jgi:VIT1/CCC1 family predicted Fe2+/Mn2+ transporter
MRKIPSFKHGESHKSHHIGWLRASVLGANDGIVSTASLIVGVASAHAAHSQILLSGVAGLVAGAMSMAAGEYVSVSSQSDTENADLAREREELENNLEYEREELAQIYVGRGVEPAVARVVAEQLMEHDAIGSHAREELGITDMQKARPIQAALASAAMFSMGAALPLAVVFIFPEQDLILMVAAASLVFLMMLGALAAGVGGAKKWKGALRVGFWGAFAMAITAAVGRFFGG